MTKTFQEKKIGIHLITYGDNKYQKSKKRLYIEAEDTGWFNTITLYGLDDLDNNYKERFADILNKPRGGGYWIWKSYIIKKKLQEINDGDILIYLDAGCTINKEGGKRFNEYINLLNNSDSGCISFYMEYKERVWTTNEIFEYFGISDNDKLMNSFQLVGGIRIMKKNDNLIKMINIEEKACYDNPLLFTDHYNKNQEQYFKENRHEQSIFSIIRKMNNPLMIKDETCYKPFGEGKSLEYPFWATRILK